ncbi:hypothetical protein [Streptomyces sp. NPDC012510]|uniref:hypothetical protein n=1 Tax=Streptomyces sp. NPDC012510 TaxID=3364838 RepID=UPI0036E8678D
MRRREALEIVLRVFRGDGLERRSLVGVFTGRVLQQDAVHPGVLGRGGERVDQLAP